MEEDCDCIDLQARRLSLIDFSSENDALILNSSSSPLPPSSGGLHHRQSAENQEEPDAFASLESFNAGIEVIMIPSSDHDDRLPDRNESSEPDGARRKGKCNLRKSLAWDSAFFTSAGVLDPEELSSMIKKNESLVLPGIQEDIRTSTDTISTLESDNLMLENVEIELFEDIRASIQKSSKAFNVPNANCKEISGKSQMKKMDLASRNQKSVPKKPVRILKSQTKTLTTQGTVKAAKQDSVHSQVPQSICRTGDSSPTFPKPPRVINKGKPISTATAKRGSLAASQSKNIANYKTTQNDTVAGNGAQALMSPVISGTRSVLPKPTSSFKSASTVSSNSTKTKSAASSSAGSSGSVSSDNVGKAHLAAVRRKIGDRNMGQHPSGSTLKTPSKAAARNRTTSGNSYVSAYLMSSKISSSISPASSISEWSSASSSSSWTVNQRSNKSRTSFEATSCKSLDDDTSGLNNQSNAQILDGHTNDGIAIHNESTRKSSTQTGTLPRADSVRPSGLRMPSPKIGFFDGARSARTPKGTMQSHATPTVLPKNGAATPTPNRRSSMKAKIEKLSHATRISALAKINTQ